MERNRLAVIIHEQVYDLEVAARLIGKGYDGASKEEIYQATVNACETQKAGRFNSMEFDLVFRKMCRCDDSLARNLHYMLSTRGQTFSTLDPTEFTKTFR
jgi:hypothetical protein